MRLYIQLKRQKVCTVKRKMRSVYVTYLVYYSGSKISKFSFFISNISKVFASRLFTSICQQQKLIKTSVDMNIEYLRGILYYLGFIVVLLCSDGYIIRYSKYKIAFTKHLLFRFAKYVSIIHVLHQSKQLHMSFYNIPLSL